MNPVHDLSPGQLPDELNVLIEVPKGAKNKYEIDKETGRVTLDRVLYGAHAYPLDYGFVPQTYWHDGDPLDVLVINTAEPYYPGAVIPCRPVALMRMVDSGEQDEKIIAVPVDDPRLAHVKDQADVAPHTLKELTDFFEHYKDLQSKKVTVEGIEGRDAAIKVITEGAKLYRDRT